MQNIQQAFNMLRQQGNYTQTDLSLYTQLTPGKIKSALSYKDPLNRYLIFNLIELKDSSLGCELQKRYNTLEGKYYTSNLDEHYEESIEEIITASLDATIFGYGVIEAYLDDNAKLCFRRIDKDYFHFENEKLYLKNKSGKKFEPKAPKFFVLQKKAHLLKTLWITFAKHFVLSHYLKFTEFLGVPPIIVNASSSDEKVIDSIAEAISRLKSGSFSILGKEDIAKVLEGKGSQADFLNFVSYVDDEIAKLINGATLTSNTGKTGSYAQSKVHEDNRYEITAKDAKNASRLIKKVFAVFGIEAKVALLVEKDKDLLVRAQTFQIVAEQGYTMTPEQIAQEFDFPLPANNTIANKKELNAKTTLAADEFSAYEPKNYDDEIKKAINAILKKATTYEEAFDLLTKALPSFKIEALEKELEKVITNSMILGSVNEND